MHRPLQEGKIFGVVLGCDSVQIDPVLFGNAFGHIRSAAVGHYQDLPDSLSGVEVGPELFHLQELPEQNDAQ